MTIDQTSTAHVLTGEQMAPLQIPVAPVPQIVTDLFPPSSQGARFVQRFLETAESATADLLTPDQQQRTICMSSISALAHRLGFAYDTTHRYVTLLQLLGMMQTQRQGRLRRFVLSTGSYTPPPTLSADLEAHITQSQQQTSRRKYVRLLREIQARCQCLGLFWQQSSVTLTEALTHMQTLTQSKQTESRRQLSARLQQIALLSTTLLHAVQTYPPDTPPPGGREIQQTMTTQTRAMQDQEMQWVSNVSASQAPESSPNQRSSPQTALSHQPSAPRTSSSISHSADGNTPNVSHNVNNNVTTIYHYITTSALRMPHLLAEWLAQQFEQDPSASRKYLKLFEQAPGVPREPHVLAAAYLCTMIRLHRDGWNIAARPGGFFTKRCREYDAGVPQEVASWIGQYGTLSLEALLPRLQEEAIERRAAATSTSSSTDHTRKPAQAESTSHVPATSAWVNEPPTPAPGMQLDPAHLVIEQEDEAYELMEKMYRDRRTRRFRTRCVESQTYQRYAVLVEVSSPGAPPLRQAFVYSEADWQARLRYMERWQDFFEPEKAQQRNTPFHEGDVA